MSTGSTGSSNNFMQKLQNPMLTDELESGNNWTTFEEHFITYFRVCGYNHKALEVFDGTEKLKNDDEELFLYLKLYESVPNHVKDTLKMNNGNRHGTVAWKNLKQHYQPNAINTHVMNYTSITQMKWKRGDKFSMTRHLQEAQNKYRIVQGKLTEEQMIIATILANMEKAPDLDYMRSRITSDVTLMTWKTVYEELKKVELEREFQDSRQAADQEVLQPGAFHTSGGGNKSNSKNLKQCTICNKGNHKTEECWSNITCTNCSKKGHPDRKCPEKKGTEGKKNTENKTKSSGGKLQLSFCTLAYTVSEPKQTIIIDGACTNTLSPCREFFTDLKTATDKSAFRTITGSKLEVEAIGTLHLKVRTSDNSDYELCFENACYAPNAEATLLSVAVLADMGHYVVYGRSEVRLMLSNDFINGRHVKAKRHGNLYYLTCSENSTDMGKSNLAYNTSMRAHLRLGHPGHDRLASTLKATTHNWDLTSNSMNCDACALNKSERHHVSTGPHAPYATRPCESFAVDVCGPFPPSILNKYRYVANYTDLFSKVTISYPMQSPSDIARTLKLWRSEWLGSENSDDKLMQPPAQITARLDNASYFQGGEFGKFINEWGWHARYCPPYAHELHPIEAINKQLLYTARTLLNNAKLPKSFWPFAYVTATYLRNRTVASREVQTPIEKHTQSKPDITHLRTFGCVAFVHDHTVRTKLDATARKGVFVGYARNSSHGTYRIYMPDTNRVVESKDVKFNEDIYYYEERNTTITSNSESPEIRLHSTTSYVPAIPTTPNTIEAEEFFADTDDGDNQETAVENEPVIDIPQLQVQEQLNPEVQPVATMNAEVQPINAGTQTPINDDHQVTTPSPIIKKKSEVQKLIDPVWNFIMNTPTLLSNTNASQSQKTVTFKAPPQGLDHVPFRSHSDSDNSDSDSDSVENGGSSTGESQDEDDDNGSGGFQDSFEQRADSDNESNVEDNSLSFEEAYSSTFMPESKRAPISTPGSYSEYLRLSTQDKELWRQAMNEEWSNFERAGTLTLIPRSEARTKPMTSKWIYKIKNNGKLKARLVVRGFGEPIENDNDIYSPTPDRTSMRIATIIALTLGWDTRVFDVDAAFLEAQIPESELYIYPPSGSNVGKEFVYRLDGSLYGLKSAPLRWFLELRKTLKALGLQQSLVDPCVYFNETIIVVAYVDDCRIFGEPSNLDTYLVKIKAIYSIKVVPINETYLGQHWHYKAEEKVCTVEQKEYVQGILKLTGHEKGKPARTPLEARTQLEDAKEDGGHPLYRSYVGKLLYLGISRPDLTFAVHQVARHCHKNNQSHFDAIKHILRYLKGTSDQGLNLHGVKTLEELNLTVFTDASWGDAHDRKSTTGFVIFLGKSPITWGSKKQSIVTLSSCEAELVAIVNAVQESIEIQQLCEEFGLRPKITIYSDSQSGISWIERGSIGRQSKHMQVRMLKMKEWIENEIFELKYIPGNLNLADLFTKALDGPTFKSHAEAILNGELTNL